MEMVEGMAHHMKAYNSDTWLYINGKILQIFKN